MSLSTANPVATAVAVPEPQAIDRTSNVTEITAKEEKETFVFNDYHVRGDKSYLICAGSGCICCYLLSQADSIVLSYPECCSCFCNLTAVCFRLQCGYVNFENPNYSIAPCYFDKAENPTCKSHSQCLFLDFRREVALLCCAREMGKDPDTLWGALTYCGWTCCPSNHCCATLEEIREKLANPEAFKCVMTMFGYGSTVGVGGVAYNSKTLIGGVSIRHY